MARLDALFRRGTELLHQGKVTEAVPLLEQAYGLDQEEMHIDLILNLSGAYVLTKRFKQAVAILEPLSAEVPDNEMVWTNLGAAYLGNPILATSAQQEKAIAAFEQALSINPIAPNVAYNIGLVYRDRQENRAAIRWFKKAIQVNPNDQDARRLVARLRKDLK